MRGSLRVPKSQYDGLASLLALDDDALLAFESALESTGHATSLHALARSVASVSDLPADSVNAMIRVLASLYAAMDRTGVVSSDFVAEIETAALETDRDDLRSPAIGWANARARLEKLLSFHKSLGITAKAFDLLRENERVFCEARVVSDMRPVFVKDVDHTPDALLILHTIHFEFHKPGGDLEGIDISMDSGDIADLLSALERAKDKESSLHKLADKMEIPVVRSKTHEE